jgi:endonuclease G, mitochondrial
MSRSKSPLDQLTPAQRILVAAAVLVIAGLVVAVRGCKERPQPTPPSGEPPSTFANRNVRFGKPAEAKADPESRNAYLIERPQYVLSYNDSTKNPNWVCWNLNKGDLGKAQRNLRFVPDPDLPAGFDRVAHGDYDGSGFDRGHMCASADRADSEENNDVTYYMTNVVPQAPNCNQKGWRLLEEYCRTLARQGNELYIACGPHGRGGVGRDNERHLHIGRTTKIEVPESVWKVVLVLPNKEAVPTQESRTIAVWMPNDQSVTTEWKSYIVSVAEVERRTGYRFFMWLLGDPGLAMKRRVDAGP